MTLSQKLADMGYDINEEASATVEQCLKTIHNANIELWSVLEYSRENSAVGKICGFSDMIDYAVESIREINNN